MLKSKLPWDGLGEGPFGGDNLGQGYEGRDPYDGINAPQEETLKSLFSVSALSVSVFPHHTHIM